MSDPGGSFRPTAGIVLISFVAGFILVGMASMPDTEGDRPTYIYGATVGQVPVEEEVVDALVSIPGIEIDEDAGSVRLPVGTDLEEGRDLLAGVIGALPITAEEMDHDLRVFAADLRKGTGVVVLIALSRPLRHWCRAPARSSAVNTLAASIWPAPMERSSRLERYRQPRPSPSLRV